MNTNAAIAGIHSKFFKESELTARIWFVPNAIRPNRKKSFPVLLHPALIPDMAPVLPDVGAAAGFLEPRKMNGTFIK
jgi:hypothetical protein